METSITDRPGPLQGSIGRIRVRNPSVMLELMPIPVRRKTLIPTLLRVPTRRLISTDPHILALLQSTTFTAAEPHPRPDIPVGHRIEHHLDPRLTPSPHSP
ncbi:hypothetical protein, partial [Micromonospora sp. NPDC048063]|uniref:hypothetical protein n=1 Tax=Micromonospora sp. NPDC048063 TaxID=3364256 RepID=UPI00371F12A6